MTCDCFTEKPETDEKQSFPLNLFQVVTTFNQAEKWQTPPPTWKTTVEEGHYRV